VQNPSIILSFFVSFLKFIRLFNYYLIVDSHNEGIEPFCEIFKKINFIYVFIQKIADVTIVTNAYLAMIVGQNGGNAFILTDKIPFPPEVDKIDLCGKFNYVFICTFAKDEPVNEFIEACDRISSDDYVYITGNYSKYGIDFGGIKSNIIFTGYLSDADYWRYLYSADCVIDLTLMDNCIVCGAYEALSVGKPILLSDTEVLRNTFGMGAMFTKNEATSLGDSLVAIKKQIHVLEEQSSAFREMFSREWERSGAMLKQKLLDVIAG
jgi:glycosyltransferase involved in cell wall biosynthesis